MQLGQKNKRHVFFTEKKKYIYTGKTKQNKTLSRWINNSVAEEVGRHISNSLISVIQAGTVNLIQELSGQGCLFVVFSQTSHWNWVVQFPGESFNETGGFPWKISLFWHSTKKYFLTKALSTPLECFLHAKILQFSYACRNDPSSETFVHTLHYSVCD